MSNAQTFYAIKLDDDSYARLEQEDHRDVYNYNGPLELAELFQDIKTATATANGINTGKDGDFYIHSDKKAVSIVEVEMRISGNYPLST